MQGESFLQAPVRVMTCNVNGLRCKVKNASRKQSRLYQLANYARAASLEVVGIQEPHTTTMAEEQMCSPKLRKFGYSFSSTWNPAGREGVALGWKASEWTCFTQEC